MLRYTWKWNKKDRNLATWLWLREVNNSRALSSMGQRACSDAWWLDHSSETGRWLWFSCELSVQQGPGIPSHVVLWLWLSYFPNRGFPGGSVVKDPSTMQEMWVWSLGWEGPLEEEMATHSSILAWKILMDRGAWQATVHGIINSPTLLRD